MEQPHRFSIVMPAYNAAGTIEAAISSVLAQDADDWELVITDDGSTDETRAICDRFAAEEPRISCASQANAGTGAALTAAIRRATGEFLVQLGADDELLPRYCSVTGAFIDAHPGFDIYASNAYRLLPDGSRELYHTAPRFQSVFEATVDDLIDEPLIYGSAAFRREIFDRVGGFRTEYYNEDYDFWLRVMLTGARHIYNPVPLALYHITPGQKTEDGVRMRLEDIRILEDALASGSLAAPQAGHAERVITRLRRNVAFRRRALALIGPRRAEPVFRLAHRIASALRRRKQES